MVPLRLWPKCQSLFQGILLLHGISARRAGSRTVVRLTLPEFQSEVEVCCALGWLNLV